MSKAARAFSSNNSEKYAGRPVHISKNNRPAETQTSSHYNESPQDFAKFVDPTPFLIRPSLYIQDVEDVVYQSSFFDRTKKFYENHIEPWAADNNITKYRMFPIYFHADTIENLPEENYAIVGKRHTISYDHIHFVGWTQHYLSAGIVFKNPDHLLMFKLTF